MLNKTVFSISHYLHHVSASDLTEPCFFFVWILSFFFALELSSRFVDHTILISIQLTNLTKSFLIDLNIRVNWNHLILFELSFSLLANTLMHLTLSLYIYFSFFLVWFVVLEMKFLSPQLAELNDLFIDIVRSVIYREPPVQIHLTYFFIYFFSYIIITRDERKKTWQDTQQNWLNWISESYHIILFLSLIH